MRCDRHQRMERCARLFLPRCLRSCGDSRLRGPNAEGDCQKACTGQTWGVRVGGVYLVIRFACDFVAVPPLRSLAGRPMTEARVAFRASQGDRAGE